MYGLQFEAMENLISHSGIVEKVDGHTVFVRIAQQAACSGCHARQACMASDKREKIIETVDESRQYAIHDAVVISARSAVGLWAVFIAFVLPLLLAVAVVVFSLHVSGNEAVGALAGLFALIPYYAVVYLFRDRLKKKIVFTLSKAPLSPLPET